LTEELFKANQTIQFLSSITGQNPQMISENIKNFDSKEEKAKALARQDSALTLKLDL
jgi:hypothetical protein